MRVEEGLLPHSFSSQYVSENESKRRKTWELFFQKHTWNICRIYLTCYIIILINLGFLFDNYILFYTEKNITHNWVANVIPMYTHRKESSFLFFLCLLPWSRNTEWWCTYKKQNMKGYMVPCGSITFLAYILQLYSYLLDTCYFLGDMTGSEEIKIIRACPLHLKT